MVSFFAAKSRRSAAGAIMEGLGSMEKDKAEKGEGDEKKGPSILEAKWFKIAVVSGSIGFTLLVAIVFSLQEYFEQRRIAREIALREAEELEHREQFRA